MEKARYSVFENKLLIIFEIIVGNIERIDAVDRFYFIVPCRVQAELVARRRRRISRVSSSEQCFATSSINFHYQQADQQKGHQVFARHCQQPT